MLMLTLLPRHVRHVLRPADVTPSLPVYNPGTDVLNVRHPRVRDNIYTTQNILNDLKQSQKIIASGKDVRKPILQARPTLPIC